MSRIVVIAEKPDAARKIANALGKVEVRIIHGTEVFDVGSSDGNRYAVSSALGHLYELSDPGVDRGISPVFDVEWFVKTNNRSKKVFGRRRQDGNSELTKRLSLFRELASNATALVNACDFDLEGETIGSNIIEFACSDIPIALLRAKFSTLTTDEIRQAFAALEPPDPNLAEAGRMRHLIDFLWGVNLSRVLSDSARGIQGEFSNVTIGRVQGPALAFVVDREIEVMSHVPLPYWKISCLLEKDGVRFTVTYGGGLIRNQSTANEIFEKISSARVALVSSVTSSSRMVPPRYPFNLAELQREAHRIYKIGPSTTLAVAQKLYMKSLISYPRTSSQKLPKSINYQKIFNGLAKSKYSDIVFLLNSMNNRRVTPWEGPGTDPAHPAIFPTGEMPRSHLDTIESKILDLVIRRFCGAFAPDATLQEINAVFDVASVQFNLSGSRVLEKGWMLVYPFWQPGSEWPNLQLNQGDKLLLVDRTREEKYDAPPPRYNEMSLVAKLTSENVGTKSTRAETVLTLVKRGYLTHKSILLPTENALVLIEHLRKDCPRIISSEMTREVETQMELLETGKESSGKILAHSLVSIFESISNLKETKISWNSEKKANQSNSVIGACPTCETGSLTVITSFKTKKRFLGCSNYSKGCRTSSPLPRRGIVKPTGKACSECNWPTVVVWLGRKPWRICPNINCPSSKRKRESLIV